MLLGVIGNPRNPQREAWEAVLEIAEAIRTDNRAAARTLERIANEQLKALDAVRVNGRMTRRGGAVQTSEHVMAIVYVHKDDGNFYCHGFGDADIDLKSRGDALTITGLKSRTHVGMFAEADGSVRIAHKDGEPLWEDVE
jgi:hypothetical protein